jgi:hypothetical protein
MLGVSTIGNAILIAYDDNPILATDPWFGDENPAYFGPHCGHILSSVSAPPSSSEIR